MNSVHLCQNKKQNKNKIIFYTRFQNDQPFSPSSHHLFRSGTCRRSLHITPRAILHVFFETPRSLLAFLRCFITLPLGLSSLLVTQLRAHYVTACEIAECEQQTVVQA